MLKISSSFINLNNQLIGDLIKYFNTIFMTMDSIAIIRTSFHIFHSYG